MIRGITVKLYEKTKTGEDGFKHPIFSEIPVEVKNVLVAPASSDGIVTDQDLQGKKEAYILAIPKGDTHDWTDTFVSFWGERFRTIGEPTQGIEAMIPLDWNKKVRAERYE